MQYVHFSSLHLLKIQRQCLKCFCTTLPRLGVFSTFPKYTIFVTFMSQFTQRVQQWSFYEMMDNILPYVLNKKRPLADSWLWRYWQKRFECIHQNASFEFLPNTPETILLISHQLWIRQRQFYIQNKWEDILNHLI